MRGNARIRRSGHAPRIVEAGFSAEEASVALRAWMRTNRAGTMPTAIVCANDAAALGCMEVLSQAGLRVPHDVSLVGFDDTIAARTAVPQLTTIRQPLRLMGAKAVELLLKPETRSQVRNNTVVFPTKPVFRASVAPPPQKRLVVPPIP
jgi:DNA-binding LacI/PurR family transcriptional regulator